MVKCEVRSRPASTFTSHLEHRQTHRDMETRGIVIEDGAVLHSKVVVPQSAAAEVAAPQVSTGEADGLSPGTPLAQERCWRFVDALRLLCVALAANPAVHTPRASRAASHPLAATMSVVDARIAKRSEPTLKVSPAP